MKRLRMMITLAVLVFCGALINTELNLYVNQGFMIEYFADSDDEFPELFKHGDGSSAS